MTKYIGQRLLASIPTVIGVCSSSSVSCISRLTTRAGMGGSYHLNAEQIDNLRQEMGLDQPFFVQLGRWLVPLPRRSGEVNRTAPAGVGDDRSPAVDDRGLALAGMLLATIMGVCGLLAALKENSVWDSTSMVVALIGSAMPDFWLALMMIFLFS